MSIGTLKMQTPFGDKPFSRSILLLYALANLVLIKKKLGCRALYCIIFLNKWKFIFDENVNVTPWILVLVQDFLVELVNLYGNVMRFTRWDYFTSVLSVVWWADLGVLQQRPLSLCAARRSGAWDCDSWVIVNIITTSCTQTTETLTRGQDDKGFHRKGQRFIVLFWESIGFILH